MKYGSTLFLKLAIVSLGAIALAICIFAVPTISREVAIFLNLAPLEYLIAFGLYSAAIPFFVALQQTFRLLNYIDQNKAFSNLSVKSLKYIKYCGTIISGIFTALMPLVYLVAEKDDAPGLIIVGMGFVGASAAIAVLAAVLQKLVQSAINLKEENDLTV